MMISSGMMQPTMIGEQKSKQVAAVDPEEVRHSEKRKTFNFIKGVLFPKFGSQALPPADSYDPIISPFNVKSTMVTNTGVQALANQRVSNQSGAIIWLPRLGYNAIAHGGFMNAQTDGSLGVGTNVGAGTISALTYNSQIWLPYSFQAAKQTIKIQPDPADSFNKVRVFNGYYDFRSVTQPATDVTLNGRMCSFVVADTTDVCQVNGEAFPQATLVTATRQEKDLAENIPAQDGIVNIIGDDIGRDFEDPNTFAVSNQKGTFAQVDTFVTGIMYAGQAVFNSVAPYTTNGDTFLFASRFITPWDVTANLSAANAAYVPGGAAQARAWAGAAWPLQYASVRTSPIGEFDRFDFKVNLLFNSNMMSVATNDTQPHDCTVVCEALHIFAGITDATTGTVKYRTVKASKSFTNPFGQRSAVGQNYSKLCSAEFDFTAEYSQLGPPSDAAAYSSSNPTTDLGANGKYIGSVLEFYVNFKPHLVLNAQNQSFSFNAAANIFAKPHGGADEGHRGPAHITRYDGLSENQELVLDGCLNMECVSKASLNQIIKSGLSGYSAPATGKALQLLHALFTDSNLSLYRSVFPRQEYWSYWGTVANATYATFASGLAENNGADTRALGAAEDSGMMDRSAFTRFNQRITDNPGVVNEDDLPQVMNMSGGQFGNYSGGQFGNYASGQFRGRNEAGGNFASNLLGGIARGAAIAGNIASLF